MIEELVIAEANSVTVDNFMVSLERNESEDLMNKVSNI